MTAATAAKKPPAKKAPVKKAAPAKKSTAKKSTPTKATTKRAPAKKAPVKKTAPTMKPGTAVQPALALPDGDLDHVDITKIHPDPDNLRDGVGDKQEFEELCTSVGQLGIITPVTLRPHDTQKGHYILVAGFRRYSAANVVGLTKLPALIKPYTDDERVEAMLVENCRRTGLTPLEEARGFQALLDRPGWSQHKVAQRVGCDQGHVSRRVSLLKLTPTAQKALATEKINIGDALELVRIADDPKAVDEIVKTATRPKDRYYRPDIDDQVRSLEHEKKSKAALDEVRAEQERLGANLLGVHDSYGGAPREFQGAKALSEVFGWDIDTKTRNAHAKEPCHGVVIVNHYDKPKADGYCTDPKRHTKKGDSGLKVPDKRAAAEAKITPAQRAEREAKDLRRTFMRQALTVRTPSRPTIIDITMRRYIADAARDERQKMCDLLTIEPLPGNGIGGKDWHNTIEQYIDASETNLLRACLAFAFVQGEWSDWNIGGRVAHLAVLRQFGYELHDSEKKLYGEELEELGAKPTAPVVVEDELDLDVPTKHAYVNGPGALCEACGLAAGDAQHWTDDRTDVIHDGVDQPRPGTISDALNAIDDMVKADEARAEELGLEPGDVVDEDGVITRAGDVDDIEAGAPTAMVCKACDQPIHFELSDGTDPDDHGGYVHTDDKSRTCFDGPIVARTKVLEKTEA